MNSIGHLTLIQQTRQITDPWELQPSLVKMVVFLSHFISSLHEDKRLVNFPLAVRN